MHARPDVTRMEILRGFSNLLARNIIHYCMYLLLSLLYNYYHTIIIIITVPTYLQIRLKDRPCVCVTSGCPYRILDHTYISLSPTSIQFALNYKRMIYSKISSYSKYNINTTHPSRMSTYWLQGHCKRAVSYAKKHQASWTGYQHRCSVRWAAARSAPK